MIHARNLLRFGFTCFYWSLLVAAAMLLVLMLSLLVTDVGPFGLVILASATLALLNVFLVPAVKTRIRALSLSWRLRFSLTSLLVTTAILSVVLTGLVLWLSTIRTKTHIVDTIRAAGGAISFHESMPEWVTSRFGISANLAFCQIDIVAIQQSPFDPSIFKSLKGLSFNRLLLYSCGLRDRDLAPLEGFPDLEMLSLQNAPITDDGLEYLASLKRLKMLDLWGTGITDSGIQHLNGLAALENLSLHGTRISDTAVSALKELPHLKVLDLSSTAVTDHGLADIQQMRNLETVYLMNTAVTNLALIELQEASPRLTILDAQGNTFSLPKIKTR